jgi:hypothetical protein
MDGICNFPGWCPASAVPPYRTVAVWMVPVAYLPIGRRDLWLHKAMIGFSDCWSNTGELAYSSPLCYEKAHDIDRDYSYNTTSK